MPPFIVDSNLNKVYAQLPAPYHRKIAAPLLPDSDGDGVPDQFDLEPNTPPGVAVDTHGRALDTDGDGVPDYKDKEKLTLQSCFPVDTNGVGVCPETGCCREFEQIARRIRHAMRGDYDDSLMYSIPFLHFPKSQMDSTGFSKEIKMFLDSALKEPLVIPHGDIKIVYRSSLDAKTMQLQKEEISIIMKYLAERNSFEGYRIITEEHGVNAKENFLEIMFVPWRPID